MTWKKRVRQFIRRVGLDVRLLLRRPFMLLLLFLLMAVWAFLRMPGTVTLTEDTGCRLKEIVHNNTGENLAYEWIMARRGTGRTDGQAKNVALITLTEGNEPLSVMTNTCAARAFYTVLVPKLAKLGAKVIAIDQRYSKDSCIDETINGAFRNALENDQLLGPPKKEGPPIVAGEATHRRPDSLDDADCLVETAPFDFNAKPGGGLLHTPDNVHYGLTRLNDNSLKIPLQWSVFPDDRSAIDNPTAPKLVEGFALVAAELADNTLIRTSAINRFNEDYEHPYASFARTVPTWTAMDVLCYGPDKVAQDAKWGVCDNIAHVPFSLDGKVAVVGLHTDAELRSFPGQDQYGVDLHAKYIEALLTKGYVRGAPHRLDVWAVVLYVVLSVVLEALGVRKILQPGVTLLFQAILFLGFLLFSCLMLALFNIFMAAFLLACIPITLSLVGSFVHWCIEQHSRHNPRMKGGLT